MSAYITAEAVLNKLKNVKHQRGRKWVASCPAHNDRLPSLTVTEGKKGLLLYCWAGCATKEVCGVLEIPMQSLFFDAAEDSSNQDAERLLQEFQRMRTPASVLELAPHQSLQDVLYAVVSVSPEAWATVAFQWEDMLSEAFAQVWDRQRNVIVDAICGDLFVEQLDAGWEFTVARRAKLMDKILAEWWAHGNK